ncbi:glycosyltransferase family 4 protein [Ammoniphilus sp. CFH 90114]|uniref:glycosyltransferase family 4 protein n=1 Tax=Ammoniphilus sp. CFH 90114 TaxID=2493665 RepID=UPI00100EA49D|nr:glycosyltransferase family 4 protein [Ammoniphilus sp. CFH 90114]RXT03676.1 glycosyltransferase WbuB [Ammoniphilus sp. CFH 90114]
MDKHQKYNIVILNHHANAPDVGGGGRHYEIAKYFSELGHEVTVLASSYDQGKKQYRVSEEINEIFFNEKFKFVRLKTKPAYKRMTGRFINYINYKNKVTKYENFNQKPNVIIASSVHPLAWEAGYKYSRRYNAKFIVEVRDLWPLSMYEDFSGITRKLIFSYFESLEKKYYNLADGIITTAPYANEYMEEKYGIEKNKIFYIPHAIDIEEFDKQIESHEDILLPELNEILDNKFCVTYTGALSKSEGLPTFVESAKYLKKYKDIILIVIGNGPEKEKLLKIIKSENLDNVLLLEKQPKNNVPLILKKSEVLFCGLLEREAFKYGISKNKFYDYMAAEKPIIFASNVRGSLISKAKAGITIEPGNAKKLSETIIHMYENIDSVGKDYSKNGRLYVEENHTVQKISERFLEIISKS